jgi:hypothetical protein
MRLGKAASPPLAPIPLPGPIPLPPPKPSAPVPVEVGSDADSIGVLPDPPMISQMVQPVSTTDPEILQSYSYFLLFAVNNCFCKIFNC